MVVLNVQIFSRVFDILIKPVQIERQLTALYLGGYPFSTGHSSIASCVEFATMAGGAILTHLLFTGLDIKGVGLTEESKKKAG
jgi:hypothetical protein